MAHSRRSIPPQSPPRENHTPSSQPGEATRCDGSPVASLAPPSPPWLDGREGDQLPETPSPLSPSSEVTQADHLATPKKRRVK